MIKIASALSFACLLAAVPLAPVVAQEIVPPVTLTLENHHFDPAKVTIPADTRVEFDVTNKDTTPAEFESDDFSAEKVLPPGETVKISIGPLKAGTYEFHDEYNEDESKSQLTVQ
jgi:heme/copper-type cytochrome/quinol oxidase subunit 2